ncbi:MAG: hypothetical protein PHH82_01005 [Candidatus ainarchaeum sp.]|nr:hypothetical protein [Candidatus ainarchaeum sp.]
MKEVLRKAKKTKDEVHLVRPVSFKEFRSHFSKKKKIHMSKSTLSRLSEQTKILIHQKKIKIIIEKIRGRPIEADPKLLAKAISLYKSGFSYREIEKKIGMPKSSVHYIVKKAKRKKIKTKKGHYSID